MVVAGKMKFETRDAGPVVVVQVGGTVAIGTEAWALRKVLREKLDAGRPTLVNLSNVQHMDSTGVGALVEAKAHAIGIGVQLRICHVPPDVDRILRGLNLREILEVYATEAQALAAYQ